MKSIRLFAFLLFFTAVLFSALSAQSPLPAPTGGAISVTQSTAILHWDDNASSKTGYLVRRTTDHVNFDVVVNLGPDVTEFRDSGLLPSTQYFYYISDKDGLSGDLIVALTTSPEQNISSTASGGNWSSPSTWVGGAVPTSADSVTITAGATVVVDTSAQAGSVTVGTAGSLAGGKRLRTEGGPAARLTFQETTGRTLTLTGSLSIEADGVFSTGAGTVDFHTVSMSGNLTNKGTLDLSTNGGLAGATIDFTGNSSTTFGGTGAVTDISRILMNKASSSNTVELTVSNFTVKGSTTDGPGSAYLFLFGGVFKISGTFTGSHRTFGTDAYDPPAAAGFWLNNPNYTVVARPAPGHINGPFRLTAGEFNVGTNGDHTFANIGPFTIEGGRLNAAGQVYVIGTSNSTVAFVGGTLAGCTVGGTFCGINVNHQSAGTFSMSGGEIVVQNSGYYRMEGTLVDVPNIAGTTLRFGNNLTSGPANFEIEGFAPNVVIDTSSGSPQTLTTKDSSLVHIMNLTIQPGGLFRMASLSVHGASVINNGQIEFFGGVLHFDDLTGLSDVVYSGTGTTQGTANNLFVRSRTLTFAQTGGNIVARNLRVTNAHLIGANHLTIGQPDLTDTLVEIFDGASLDAAPAFGLGPTGQKIVYRGTNTTGPEINPTRFLNQLTFIAPGTLTLSGGDLAMTTLTFQNGGIINTGGATISTQLPFGTAPAGYVDGNLRMQMASGHAGHSYTFPVGQNGDGRVTVTVTSVSGPSALTIRSVDMTLPGLDPTVSLSRYWTIAEEGSVVAGLSFSYPPSDIIGNPANYLRWRSNGGTPVQVGPGNIDQLTGDWGLGQRLAPTSVSISGSVTTSTGQPIRNALVTLSGGGLPNPITTATGTFGTYLFQDVPINHIYTVRVDAKRYRFTPSSQEVNATNDVTNVNFTANPQE